MKKNFTILFFICFGLLSKAQNFVINPDFEIFAPCPTMNGELQNANNWLDVVYSCDYMNCAFQGWTTQTIPGAQNGSGYAGFATYGNTNGAAEAFGQFLSSPLIPGHTYKINFYAKRSNSGFYSSVCAGVCIYGFSGNPVAAGAQTGICAGTLPGAVPLGCSDTVIDVLWQPYTITFTAPSSLDFIVLTPGCAINCAEYIYIDNIHFTEAILFEDTCLGDTTAFTMLDTTSMISASWTFSDPASGINNTSTLFNPTHVFTSTGTFLVRVIRTYLNGFTDTVIVPVTIVPCVGVTAMFQAADSLICPGTCTDFSNFSINATSYQWLFNGGNPSVSTDVNPLGICYNNPGSYDVQLIASDGAISDTLTFFNYVTVYPYPPPQGIIQSGDSLIANQGAVTYQWYFDGMLIPGATNYFYIAPQSGDYNVVCTDLNDCEVEAVIFDVIAGIPFEVLSLKFEVFPNPANGHISIWSDNSFSVNGIYNMLNQKVIDEIQIDQKDFDLSSLSEGIYWIEIVSEKQMFRIKLIKE